MTHPPRRTQIRYRIIALAMLMAFMLYLDRNCMGDLVKSMSFNQTTQLSATQTGWILSAFYFTYALFQVPSGWAADRFGARPMLTLYIVLWSLFTLMTGFMTGFVGLLAARLLCGVGQAGAYPTSMALIRKWIPLEGTASASGMVSLGGRVGGTTAPFLTSGIIRNVRNYRIPLWIYGVGGLFVAAFFWICVRSTPQEHRKVTARELELIGRPEGEKPLTGRELLGALWCFTKSLSLWCNSASQFLVNIGWGFLVTWLPTYLVRERHVEEFKAGLMVTLVLAFGIPAQIAGGLYCDWATRRFGIRWGRLLPMSSSMFLCAAAYVCCPFIESPWLLVGCCALVSFGTDVANPAGWAFISDVGGRATASAGGWNNMWGNFGASATSIMIPWLMVVGGGNFKILVFFTLAGAFVLAGLVLLPMDATKKLLPEDALVPEAVGGFPVILTSNA